MLWQPLRPALRANALRPCWARQNSIKVLQAAFRDPSSPYYLAPGTQGPASPDEPVPNAETVDTTLPKDAVESAGQKLIAAGCDAESFWEQRIVWGDQDSFQHVNNVRYLRFFESSRIQWMMSLGNALGGPSRAQDMIKGKGLSLILKSVEVQFRRPVTYPDTLLIGYRIKLPSEAPPNLKEDPATFYVKGSAYSLGQKAFVAHSNEALVWYDYDNLRKCDPGEEIRNFVWSRATKH